MYPLLHLKLEQLQMLIWGQIAYEDSSRNFYMTRYFLILLESKRFYVKFFKTHDAFYCFAFPRHFLHIFS